MSDGFGTSGASPLFNAIQPADRLMLLPPLNVPLLLALRLSDPSLLIPTKLSLYNNMAFLALACMRLPSMATACSPRMLITPRAFMLMLRSACKLMSP